MILPDFNRNPGEGQLTPQEREFIYETILKYKPELCVEIGTWKGGGSTYIISSALKNLGSGLLHTFELDHEFYGHATRLYEGELNYLKEHIVFHEGKAFDLIPDFIKNRDIDFFMLDGDDDSEQTLMEFALVNYKMMNGGIIVCHDWYGSGKQHLTRHILLNSDRYEKIFDSKASTGMAVFKKHSS